MSEKIKVIVKEPGKAAQICEIEDGLSVLQELVGGYIEVVPGRHGSLIICNETGKLLGLKPNFMYPTEGDPYDVISGTAVIVGQAGEEFTDIPEKAEKYYKMLWGERWV